jgi:hypothetical protein
VQDARKELDIKEEDREEAAAEREELMGVIPPCRTGCVHDQIRVQVS